MKILVIGSNSFLAKEIKNYFFNKEITYLNRQHLDLEDNKNVDLFFKNNFFDIVINTCALGGKRGIQDDFSVLNSNLNMFNNLLRNKTKYKFLFTFCSGAAFDRSLEINSLKEEEIHHRTPNDYYGLSKNIISREISKHNNIYNFRIFGCFGKHELETRFIKNSLLRINEDKDILIHKNKYIDYISAEDLCRILEYYTENASLVVHRDINLVYKNKIKLSDLAEKIILFKNSKQSVIIEEEGLDRSYTGDGTKLSSLPINLSGLDNSLLRIIYD